MKEPKKFTLEELEILDQCMISVMNTFDNLELPYPKKLERVNKRLSSWYTYEDKLQESKEEDKYDDN